MKNWKRWLGLGLLLVLVLLAWLLWPDRRLAQAKALQTELFGPQGRSLSPEQRREKWSQYRKLQEKLSPTQRESLNAESRKRRQQEMARYFRMSAAEKARHLDDQIRRMEKMRQQAKNNQAKGAAGSGRGGSNTPGSGVRSSGPSSGSNRTTAVRDQRRQRRLDSTTAAERAMLSQYFKDLNARRTQLGLPAMGRGPGPQRRGL